MDLLTAIEVLRRELQELMLKNSNISEQVIAKSRELDRLLNEYYEMLTSEQGTD